MSSWRPQRPKRTLETPAQAFSKLIKSKARPEYYQQSIDDYNAPLNERLKEKADSSELKEEADRIALSAGRSANIREMTDFMIIAWATTYVAVIEDSTKRLFLEFSPQNLHERELLGKAKRVRYIGHILRESSTAVNSRSGNPQEAWLTKAFQLYFHQE